MISSDILADAEYLAGAQVMAVREATKGCTRDDCRLMERGATSGTLGWVPTYDRNGIVTNPQDKITRYFSCLVCGEMMVVST